MQTQPIPLVTRYFNAHGLYEERIPLITWHFYPDRGWKRQTYRKHVSRSWLRKVRDQEGATHVALTLGGRTADFSIAELLRSD